MDARLGSLAACLTLVLGACAADSPWQHEVGLSHPLVGRIFRVADGAPVGEAALIADAAAADFVLIGERHDNRDHHRIQAELVAALQARSQKPRAVAFEMIAADRQLEIVEYLDAHADATGLGAAIGWEASGWPDWAWYQPIAAAALAHGGEIVAADLTRSEKDAAFAYGPQALRSPFVRRTGLDQVWPAALRTALREELRAAHCGRSPDEVLTGMYRVQRARDAMMADRLAAASGEAGGVLIAGNGHVRKDRGVPWYLARLRPGARTVSIGLLEVQDDVLEPAPDLPFDYVWFTPRVDDGEPCAAFDAAPRRWRQAEASAGGIGTAARH